MEAPNHREIPPKKTVSRKIIAFITFQFLFLCVFNVVNICDLLEHLSSFLFLDVRVPIQWVHAYANASASICGMERVPTPELKSLHGCLHGFRCWMVIYLVRDYCAYKDLPTWLCLCNKTINGFRMLSRMPAHAYADYKMKSGLHELTVWGSKPQEESSQSPGLTNRLLCRWVVHCRCCGRIEIIVRMSVYDQSAEDEDNDDDEQEWWWP